MQQVFPYRSGYVLMAVSYVAMQHERGTVQILLHGHIQLCAQDNNGTAYLVRSIGSQVNDHIGVSRLAPDYLDTRCGPASI